MVPRATPPQEEGVSMSDGAYCAEGLNLLDSQYYGEIEKLSSELDRVRMTIESRDYDGHTLPITFVEKFLQGPQTSVAIALEFSRHYRDRKLRNIVEYVEVRCRNKSYNEYYDVVRISPEFIGYFRRFSDELLQDRYSYCEIYNELAHITHLAYLEVAAKRDELEEYILRQIQNMPEGEPDSAFYSIKGNPRVLELFHGDPLERIFLAAPQYVAKKRYPAVD
jgi:hypothetical protein